MFTQHVDTWITRHGSFSIMANVFRLVIFPNINSRMVVGGAGVSLAVPVAKTLVELVKQSNSQSRTSAGDIDTQS